MNTTNEATTPTLGTVAPAHAGTVRHDPGTAEVEVAIRALRPRIGVLALAGSLLLALGMGCQTTPEVLRAADAPSGEGASTTRPRGHASPIEPIADTGSAQNKREPMKITESGSGRNILVLHGGGGPATMAGLVAHLAEGAHVITPTHPGWNGTPRPESISSVAALADEYMRYLDEHDVKDVLVIGSSLGGWLGAELALRDAAHRMTGLVIINGVGVNIPGHPITNISRFTPQEIAKVAFHDPANFGKGAPPPTPESIAMMRANQATLAVFAGDPYCYDPTLLGRLSGIHVPTLVLWGASDQVVTKEYGLAYAAAIPNARFETVAAAGHLPWLEQPAETFRLLEPFVTAAAAPAHR